MLYFPSLWLFCKYQFVFLKKVKGLICFIFYLAFCFEDSSLSSVQEIFKPLFQTFFLPYEHYYYYWNSYYTYAKTSWFFPSMSLKFALISFFSFSLCVAFWMFQPAYLLIFFSSMSSLPYILSIIVLFQWLLFYLIENSFRFMLVKAENSGFYN